jgi:hypothetical protein
MLAEYEQRKADGHQSARLQKKHRLIIKKAARKLRVSEAEVVRCALDA